MHEQHDSSDYIAFTESEASSIDQNSSDAFKESIELTYAKDYLKRLRSATDDNNWRLRGCYE